MNVFPLKVMPDTEPGPFLKDKALWPWQKKKTKKKNWPPQQKQEECGEKANITFDNAQKIPK